MDENTLTDFLLKMSEKDKTDFVLMVYDRETGDTAHFSEGTIHARIGLAKMLLEIELGSFAAVDDEEDEE
jgi:hypothetical protein